MEIVFLGTSSGTPTKERNVSGLALTLESGRGWYLVDCGEATQHQLLHTSLSAVGLKAVFITHIHGDHCYGLPGLLASAAMAGRTAPLNIIAPEGIAGWLDATRKLTALHLPYELKFTATESLAVWRDEDLVIEAIALSHRVPSYAYSFTEAKREAKLNSEKLLHDGIPQGPLWGRLKAGESIVHEGRTLHPGDYLHYPNKARRIVVAGDNDQPELLREACAEAQVLVHEATYTREVAARNDNAFQHCTAERVATFAESVGLPNLLLTHFSARYQADTSHSPSIADIQMEAAARYHGGLFLAEDFARYRLSKKGELELAG